MRLTNNYLGNSIPDIDRDVMEAFDSDFNPDIDGVPQEDGFFKGKFTVTITWEP